MTPCSVCGGPFHPATGHEFPTGGRWCGPCTRDFVKFLKTQQSRRWGKVHFYEHASPPAMTKFCECRFCVEAARFLPVANGGQYEISRGALVKGGAEVGVVGPWHETPHVKAFWECQSEAEALALAMNMNGGFVPPPFEEENVP